MFRLTMQELLNIEKINSFKSKPKNRGIYVHFWYNWKSLINGFPRGDFIIFRPKVGEI
jgi:hypothetical protein